MRFGSTPRIVFSFSSFVSVLPLLVASLAFKVSFQEHRGNAYWYLLPSLPSLRECPKYMQLLLLRHSSLMWSFFSFWRNLRQPLAARGACPKFALWDLDCAFCHFLFTSSSISFSNLLALRLVLPPSNSLSCWGDTLEACFPDQFIVSTYSWGQFRSATGYLLLFSILIPEGAS